MQHLDLGEAQLTAGSVDRSPPPSLQFPCNSHKAPLNCLSSPPPAAISSTFSVLEVPSLASFSS